MFDHKKQRKIKISIKKLEQMYGHAYRQLRPTHRPTILCQRMNCQSLVCQLRRDQIVSSNKLVGVVTMPKCHCTAQICLVHELFCPLVEQLIICFPDATKSRKNTLLMSFMLILKYFLYFKKFSE